MRLGFDLGGTNLAYGIVDEGKIIEKGSVKLTDLSPEAISNHMTKAYLELKEKYTITAVGIGVPGIVSQLDGIVVKCVNLNWVMVPLAELLKEHIEVPIVVGNDANAACIGEVAFGGMKGYHDAILLTLGTGLGGGVVAGGKLLLGHQGAGTEIGHMIISSGEATCNCGNKGCFETYVSATALIRKYNELGTTHVQDAKSVFDRLENGDDVAVEVVDWFCEHFATGIVNLYNIFAPEVIALGGGVAKAFPKFESRLLHAISNRLFTNDLTYGKIVEAELGNDAGIIGAAYLADYQ